MSKQKRLLPLFIILFVAGMLRFYNLTFDFPYFFNPDERNMASAVTYFRLPNNLKDILPCIIEEWKKIGSDQKGTIDPPSVTCTLNPHFYAYGQFPLYLAFASDQIMQPITRILNSVAQRINKNTLLESDLHTPYRSTPFPAAVFWLRFYGSVASVGTVLLVYAISTLLFPTVFFQFVPSLLTSFLPGLIQSAHFGTTESLLMFFFFLSIYLSLKLLSLSHKRFFSNIKYLVLLSLTIGFAVGSKLTGLFFFFPPLFALFLRLYSIKRKPFKQFVLVSCLHISMVLFLLLGSFFVSFASSFYNFVEYSYFRGAVFGYEADVALGRFEAFYTRQFIHTTPFLFQVEKVFPYTLGLPVFILGSIGLLALYIHLIATVILPIRESIKYYVLGIRRKIKRKNILTTYYLLLTASFLIFLIPNSLLYAKWSRFMTPILPFFAIFSAVTLQAIYQRMNNIAVKRKDLRFLVLVLSFALCVLSFLPGVAFTSIYRKQDSRLASSYWMYKNIPGGAYLLSETANVVDIPLGIPNINAQPPYTLISFDFYHMSENPALWEQLYDHLEKADFILVPSRRIFANHIRLGGKYEVIKKYHQLLFSGLLGYEKVAEFSSFPMLSLGPLSLSFPDEQAEETFTVFDHPVVRIFKKITPLHKDEYRTLFQ